MKNLIALIAAIAALLTSLGSLYKAVAGGKETDLMLRSVYEVSTSQVATLRERVAVLEATCERQAPGCRADPDCGAGLACKGGHCIAMAAPAPHRLSYDAVQKYVQMKQAPLDLAAPDAPAAE